jgi:phage baseplate assembly protein W
LATIINNKVPIDLDNRKIIGFRFPLNGEAVFIPTYQTKDQIKANLINYILTNHYERVFQPTFGSNLKRLIFEAINQGTLDELQSVIESDIKQYFPFIQIIEIKLTPNYDSNSINFLLSYSIPALGVDDYINILLQQ